MRYKFASLFRLKSDPFRGNCGMLLLLILGLIGWVAACNPAAAGAPSVESQAHTLFLDTWSKDNAENKLIALDPVTLDDQPDGKRLEPGILSADGSTMVDVEYPEGRASLNPEDIWIVVYNLQSGAERSRFHPPVRGFVSNLSENGARLLLQPDSYPPSRYPPTVEWYVVDTSSGELLAHVEDAENSCFRQGAHLDPAGQRIYCVVDPAITGVDEPESVQVAAYSVESGIKAGELELPEVLIGGSQTELHGQPVEEFLEPAMELSPDGQRLAIVHADADKITLIDAHSLTVEKTFSLKRSMNLWAWFGFAPARAHTKGQMQGTIRHATLSFDGQYLYVFSQEVWVRPEDAPAERGLWLVDLQQERLVATALPENQIQWVRSAADGTVYVFGTTEKRLLPYEIRSTSPSMLWRLDGLTLEILAERAFTGFLHGQLVDGAVAPASHEAISTNAQYLDCAGNSRVNIRALNSHLCSGCLRSEASGFWYFLVEK